MLNPEKRLPQCYLGIGRLDNPQIINANARLAAAKIVDLLKAGNPLSALEEAEELLADLNGTIKQTSDQFAALHALPPVWKVDLGLHAVRSRILASVWPGGRTDKHGNYLWGDNDVTFVISPKDNWRVRNPLSAIYGTGLTAAVAHQRGEYLHDFIANEPTSEWES